MSEDDYNLNTEDMFDVTDQLDIEAFVTEDPQFKKDTLILKISGKYVEFSPIGLNIGVDFSQKILNCLK